MMPLDAKTLEGLDLLAGLRPEEIEQVRLIAATLKVIEGEVLTDREASARTLYINLTGNFLLSYEDGRATTLHARGTPMGLPSLLPPFRHTETTTALTVGEVLFVSGEALRQLLQESPELGARLLPRLHQAAAQRSFSTTVPETANES